MKFFIAENIASDTLVEIPENVFHLLCESLKVDFVKSAWRVKYAQQSSGNFPACLILEATDIRDWIQRAKADLTPNQTP